MAQDGIYLDASDFISGLTVDMSKLQRQTLPRAMQRIGLTMQDVAQGRVPVDTGHLKSSITHEETNSRLEYRVAVGSNVEYAPYVEYGTGDTGASSPGGQWYGDHPSGVTHTAGWPGQRAQPYLRPAVYDMQDTYVEMIREAFKQAVKG